MIRRPPRSTPKPSSAASDVYKRQPLEKSRAPPPGAPGQPPEDGRLERGRILWFDRDKNFGFIAAEVGGENVFIHGFDVKGFEPDSGDPRTSRPPAKNDLCVFIRRRLLPTTHYRHPRRPVGTSPSASGGTGPRASDFWGERSTRRRRMMIYTCKNSTCCAPR